MKETGSITTFEATRLLDVYDPRPRVHELRHQFGYPITTAMRAEQTESSVLHRVGTYFLTAEKGRQHDESDFSEIDGRSEARLSCVRA